MIDSDWYCDYCGAYMNNQQGFNTISGRWVCRKCNTKNDVSESNIVSDDFVGVLRSYKHPDGTKETVRFTKTREVHDFESPNGRRGKVWKRRFN